MKNPDAAPLVQSATTAIEEVKLAVEQALAVVAKVNERFAGIGPGVTITGVQDIANIVIGLTAYSTQMQNALDVLNTKPGDPAGDAAPRPVVMP